MKEFQVGQIITVPLDGERRAATIVEVLNTMVFAELEDGREAFFFKAEVLHV